MARWIGRKNKKQIELSKSVEFLAKGYDEYATFKKQMESDVGKLTQKLKNLEEKINKFDEALESLLQYSYQYNIKITGLKQTRQRRETAEESMKLCLKLFHALGANVQEYDIDIAHRVQSRNKENLFSQPIICKFTRRIAKELVNSLVIYLKIFLITD